MADLLTNIFAFIYTIGHLIGEKIVWLIQSISGVVLPSIITDAIGTLVILTIFLALADVAKKIVWIVVTIGWILIFMRIIIFILLLR